MVILRAIAAADLLADDRTGGGAPIQEGLERIGWFGAGQCRVVGASRRASMVCCWFLNVSLEMRLAIGLASSLVGVCGLEARENGRGVGLSACSKTALMLRNCGLALRLRWSGGFIGGKCMVGV